MTTNNTQNNHRCIRRKCERCEPVAYPVTMNGMDGFLIGFACSIHNKRPDLVFVHPGYAYEFMRKEYNN